MQGGGLNPGLRIDVSKTYDDYNGMGQKYNMSPHVSPLDSPKIMNDIPE